MTVVISITCRHSDPLHHAMGLRWDALLRIEGVWDRPSMHSNTIKDHAPDTLSKRFRSPAESTRVEVFKDRLELFLAGMFVW